MLVQVEVHKGEHGFGIYFTRVGSHVLVEGFVRAEDGAAGPAEDAGTIAIDDVLEQINGVDITAMEMTDVINQLRAAPKGPNVLTFRRADDCAAHALTPPQSSASNNDDDGADEWQSPAWWVEFESLKAAEHAKWSASILSEAAFCDHLYADSDAQHKSYLRQQYPTLMAKFQASFQPWPTPVLACTPTAYSKASHKCGVSSIEPSACLRGLLECVRVKFGWTRGEIQGLMLALQCQHDVGSAVDLVRALRRADGHSLVLHQAPSLPTVKFPRLTKAMWDFLSASALHVLSPDELAFVNDSSEIS